jgi:transcriptional regulator with XRE-family HTH domain
VTQQEAFGRRLRQLRREKSAAEERDVEQTEVAAAVGTTQVNVARWEAGRIPKEDAMLKALAGFYGVSLLWLRYGEGSRAPGTEGMADTATGAPRMEQHKAQRVYIPQKKRGSGGK